MVSSARTIKAWPSQESVHQYVLRYLQDVEGFAVLSDGHHPIGGSTEIVVEGQASHRLIIVRGWPQGISLLRTASGSIRKVRSEHLARSWMAALVLDLALNRGAAPDLDLSLALPATPAYVRYLQGLRWFLAAARVSTYLVGKDGNVTVIAPGASAASLYRAPTTEAKSSRRKLGLPGASRMQLPLLHVLIEAGGSVSRAACIAALAPWFVEVPQPLPEEFSQRVSLAHSTLKSEGLTEQHERGVWVITDAGRAAHDAEWPAWLRKHRATDDSEASPDVQT
jgi:hypothetical protein